MRKTIRAFSFVFVTLVIACGFFGFSQKAHAALGAVTGYAYSDGMGYINMAANGQVGSGVFTDTTTGTLSGYASYGWSGTNAGYITFNAAELVGCPSGFCGTGFNLATGQLRGWARACYVFVSGCSGALKPQYQNGSSEGWISLDCANTVSCGTVNYRVIISLTNGSVTSDPTTGQGFAWGGDDTTGAENFGYIDFGAVSFPTLSVPTSPILKIEKNPAWTKTNGVDQCIDPGDVYSPQVTLDISSLPNPTNTQARCDVNWGKDICFIQAGAGGPCNNRAYAGTGNFTGEFNVFRTNTMYYPNPTFNTTIPHTLPPRPPNYDLMGIDLNSGTAFSEAFPPTDLTRPSAMEYGLYAIGNRFLAYSDDAVHAGVTGLGWMTVDFRYPREVYFDIDYQTVYNAPGHYNSVTKTWTILHPAPAISTTTPLPGGTITFKLNDALSAAYATTAHNDPSIGPHQQCIIYPETKGSYNNAAITTGLTTPHPGVDPIYVKPLPPYDGFSLGYCPITATISAAVVECQEYGTPLTVTWSIPSTNATACTADIACTNPGGQAVSCSGWSGAKSFTAGSHSQSVNITATGGAQNLSAILSLTCTNPTSSKTTTVSTNVDIAGTCFVTPYCGDNIVNNGEECDDGNTQGGDGCTGECTDEVCGNHYTDIGEECDLGNPSTNPALCTNSCKKVVIGGGGICGNGLPDAGEQCDDGNTNNNDACHNDCTKNVGGGSTVCGNNIQEAGEACDDGNTIPGDGCSAICTIESNGGPLCGNGLPNAGEQCDDGNTNNTDACHNNCTLNTGGPGGGTGGTGGGIFFEEF